MARSEERAPQEQFAANTRPRSVERRCDDYRRAFLLVLQEPFDDLDKTLERMLEVLATTLDVSRVGFWVFDEKQDCIRCEHVYRRDPSIPMGTTVLHRSACPIYFKALCQELVVAAHDARADPRTTELTAGYLEPLAVHSMLDVPVRAFGRHLGVLCHEQSGSNRTWTPEDENFASGVATQIALAYERDRSRRAQEHLLERSLRDEESQLPNRLQLEQAVAAYFDNPARTGALIVTSVDQYNYVAGSLGMRRMRTLLRQFGDRLQASAPEGALVARIATNEFAVLLRATGRKELASLVEQMNAAARLPLVNEGQRLFLTLSMGFATIDATQVQTAESLIAEAQMAAQEARAAGGDRIAPFTSNMRNEMRNRISLEQDLRRGLDAAEFDLHFQPIVPLNGAGGLALEALLRWRHPQKGVLAPADFLDVAIESGIMLELGRRVLTAGCAALANLRARPGLEDLQVTINMSAPEILLPGTADAVRMELARHDLPAAALTIEITETALMVDLERAAVAIGEIRALGVKISLDDFGTAYSSLSWLRRLPIDKIKIDRCFVAGLGQDSGDLAIINAIIQLARAFKREVVAEGVETEAQLRILREIGVEHAQGYLFAHPASLEKLDTERLLKMRSGPFCQEMGPDPKSGIGA